MKVLMAAVLTIGCVGASDAQAQYREVGRYYSQKMVITSEQHDPLRQTVQLNLPSTVQTIEQAFRFLLGPTGYTLADLPTIDPHFIELASKPVPVSQRAMTGTVLQLLHVLAGDSFIAVRDDIGRTITMDTVGV